MSPLSLLVVVVVACLYLATASPVGPHDLQTFIDKDLDCLPHADGSPLPSRCGRPVEEGEGVVTVTVCRLNEIYVPEVNMCELTNHHRHSSRLYDPRMAASRFYPLTRSFRRPSYITHLQ